MAIFQGFPPPVLKFLAKALSQLPLLNAKLDIFGMLLKCLFVLLTIVFATVAIYAQSSVTQATLSGLVRDTSGAVVAGAHVTIREVATGLERTTTSDDEGRYQLLAIPPGDYALNAESDNIGDYHNPRVTIMVGQA